jgi:ATP-dependent Clp protease ATP-binding subunit ClpA
VELRPELASLLEACRSEAKRWGASSLDVLLLASAVAVRWPQEFATQFGEQGRGRLEARLSGGTRVGDEAAVLRTLEEANGPNPIDALVLQLHRRLLPELEEQDSSPPQAGAEASDANAFALPQRTARFLELVVPDAGVQGREDVVDDILAVAGRREPSTPLLVGRTGSGKTAVLRALAARLSEPSYDGPLAGYPIVRIRSEAVLSDQRGATLRRILDDLDGTALLAVDDLDVLARLGSLQVDGDTLGVIRGAVGHPALRLVCLIDADYESRLALLDEELSDELVRIDIPEPSAPSVLAIANATAVRLALEHRVTLSSDVVALAVTPASSADRRRHPGLALGRLDSACARAALRRDRTVTIADLQLARTPDIAPPDPQAITERLVLRVMGQSAAISRVAGRLALTRARLDLRPERPDGVFLFVGPTGVGKTELAKAICLEMYGEDDRLVRLDMSEYVHDWSVSRLIGPQPGYVGSTEPDSWLTTRIAKCPDTVVLFDEIEKAHPVVWNTLLQVFDAGRLSDSRGTVADFSSTVIIMTSNLGAGAFKGPSLGFGTTTTSGLDDERVILAVKQAMAPELINRLDDIVVFHPLTRADIRGIARKEVVLVLDRMSARGYTVSVDDDVIDHIAEVGYDAAYGARHLQRNIERLLLEPLTRANGLNLVARLDGTEIRWS